MFFTILANVFYASIEMPGGGVEFYCIPLGFGTFLSIENKRTCWFLIFLCTVTFFASYFLQDTYVPAYPISEQSRTIMFVMILTSNFFLCSIFVYQFRLVNERHEKVINEQKAHLAEKNKDITDSLNYAKRIQDAKLPDENVVRSVFPDSFVLFRPKDIVSGDFYYFRNANGLAFVAAADCTGHGVPGAFMSIIGMERLDDVVGSTMDTSEILTRLNKGIRVSLRQSDSDDSTRDGMDIALCAFDPATRVLKYSGANRPLWIVRKNSNEVQEFKATKKALGGLTTDDQQFESHTVQLNSGDTFYIFSDGYADSINGVNGKKMTTKRFRELLLSIREMPLNTQKIHLMTFLRSWQGATEQVDDVLVIGIRV